KAKADIAAATARTAEYEQRLREARLAIFKHQEGRRQKAMQARAEALTDARNRAHAELEKVRAGIEQDKVAAQESLQAESGRRASEIIGTVLRPGGTQVPAGGAR